MKPAKIFQQYIWLVTLLRLHPRLTLEEISSRWIHDKVIDGKPLIRASFFRHKDAILNMFGIVIECDVDNGYRYYIANPEMLDEGSVESWMLSTLTVNNALSNSTSLKGRILLENVPAGEEYLQIIINAMRTERCVNMTYRRFGGESQQRVVAPYALKLFHRRWYMLAHTGNHLAVWSLDRMLSVSLSDENFVMPKDFSASEYFKDYFGVTTTAEVPLVHVVIRVSGWAPDYLRTLPLHHSQKELVSTTDYTDFSLDIRPTPDFIGELMSYGDSLEVLQPEDLRLKICKILQDSLNKY